MEQRLKSPLGANRITGYYGAMDMTDPDFLLSCYRIGLFPWSSRGNLGEFYFPAERYIILPSMIKVPKSIKPYFNQGKFSLSIDSAFGDVVKSCQYAKRPNSEATWITEVYQEVYGKMNEMGYAHSVEVWRDGNLVGGLYGVAVGKVFTGESMFSTESNASRFALIALASLLDRHGFICIDCQVYNDYVASFGGGTVSREEFYKLMKYNHLNEDLVGDWGDLLLDQHP